MPPIDEALPVQSVDELIRLARTLLAAKPGDPEAAALLRRIAAASGNSYWQQIVEQILREPAPSTGLSGAASWLGRFLQDNVWEYLRTKGGVAVVTAVAAASGGWWAARESAKPDLVRRSDAERVFTDGSKDLQQTLFEADGKQKAVKPDQVKEVMDRNLKSLRELPAP